MADKIFVGLGDRQISVNLTGGEPLIYEDLFRLTDHLGRFSNLAEISIITNGTCFDRALVEKLNANEQIRYLKISLEAPVASVNDAIRGAGHFHLVRQNLQKFREQTDKSIVLMITLSRLNIDLIGQTIEFAVRQNLNGIIFERFVPLGRGRQMADQQLSPALWNRGLRDILQASRIDASIGDLLAYKAFWLTLEKGAVANLAGAECNLGEESMALMPSGEVFPCRRLPVIVGNVLTDEFPFILQRLAEFSPAKIKARLSGKVCSTCEVKECAGCRALASAAANDMLADDPSCPLLLS